MENLKFGTYVIIFMKNILWYFIQFHINFLFLASIFKTMSNDFNREFKDEKIFKPSKFCELTRVFILYSGENIF